MLFNINRLYVNVIDRNIVEKHKDYFKQKARTIYCQYRIRNIRHDKLLAKNKKCSN